MNKRELTSQVEDLHNTLNEYIEHSPNIVEKVLKLAKLSSQIKHKLNTKASARELQRRNLTNEYIKGFNSLDIHEALEINIKEARKKVKNFDFTDSEKNIILDRFCGGAEKFIKEHSGEVNN